ncbi:MAG: hypothetical protein P3B98_03315 [Gemmatimonadota bacterium]|nr:hypothetical protein [Gemmatimonadota bacterium]
MTPTTLLRIAFGSTALFAAAHTAGTVHTGVRDAQEQAVFDAMKAYQFDAMGVMRTPFDFYYGLGLYLSLFLVVMAVLLWLLAGMARTAPKQARPMVGVLALANLASAALCLWKFFPAPLVLSLASAASLSGAWWGLRARG